MRTGTHRVVGLVRIGLFLLVALLVLDGLWPGGVTDAAAPTRPLAAAPTPPPIEVPEVRRAPMPPPMPMPHPPGTDFIPPPWISRT
jgi:hypothetical protein